MLISISDILTELDGVPSATSPPSVNVSLSNQSKHRASPSNPTHEYYIQSHIFLRLILNKVLGSLHTANEAYITPGEAGPIVSSLSIKLDTWYQSLPLEIQFSRHISSFNLTSRVMSSRIVGILFVNSCAGTDVCDSGNCPCDTMPVILCSIAQSSLW